MDECNQRVLGAGTRLRIDETDAAGLELLERGANILDSQRHVVETRPPLLDVLCDR